MFMSKNTKDYYLKIISKCKEIFLKKNKDYGMSWAVLRLPSLTDQIFIKANRIRTIEESNKNIIGDSIESEYQSIINYCIIAMISCENKLEYDKPLSLSELEALYDKYVQNTFELMLMKNSDYGEVWRQMRNTSLTDLIITKLLRIKQIEDNKGVTEVSEGVFSNYQDIMNYSIFSIIKINESNHESKL